MKLQIHRSGNKNKQGEAYISGYSVRITKMELEMSGISPEDEVDKIIEKGKIIIQKKPIN